MDERLTAAPVMSPLAARRSPLAARRYSLQTSQRPTASCAIA